MQPPTPPRCPLSRDKATRHEPSRPHGREQLFRSYGCFLPEQTTYQVTVTPTTSVDSLFVTVSYTASVPTTLTRLMGITALPITGRSTAVAQFPKYVDFYLLLDNSPSMGLAATTTDISNMQVAAGGCAFACHQHTFNAQGKITGDTPMTIIISPKTTVSHPY